jgi:5'-nucleotidase
MVGGRGVLTWLVVSVAVASMAAAQSPSRTVTISLVATTDLHGAVLPRGDRGGVALLGGYLRNLRAARARDGGGVLLVDSGDLFQGTLESNLNEGAAVIRAYNRLGYQAAAIGNHEFDFGPVGAEATARRSGEDPRGALKARTREARFPFLAANLIDEVSGRPLALPNVKPSVIVTVAGVRVGLVGVTTSATLQTTIADNVRGLRVAPLAPTIEAEARRLRRDGASVVVVLAHAGGRCTRLDDASAVASCEPDAEVMQVVRALPAGLVDVLAAGHTHQGMAQMIEGVAVVEGFSSGRSISRVDLTVDRATKAVTARTIRPPQDVCGRVDSNGACDPARSGTDRTVARYEGVAVQPDAAVASTIARAVRDASALKNKPLGVQVDGALVPAPERESALYDIVADGMRAAVPGADVAFGNGGGIRTEIPAGPLTYGRVYEVYPFDNRLATISMSGAQLTAILKANLERTEPPREILSISGVRVLASCEGGTLTVALTREDGRPIAPADTLLAVTSDFVATGGDGVLAPAGSLPAAATPPGAPLARDAVAGWLQRRGGTVSEAEVVTDATRRWRFPGSRPVRCVP